VIVASVSCIYGLGSPEAYYGMLLMLEKGQKISRNEILAKLVEILYDRNDADFRRGTFRVRGDVIDIFPTYDDYAYRIELWGDEVESLAQIDPLARHRKTDVYPAADLSQDSLRDE
jgi:excinuclease ABC subunit B